MLCAKQARRICQFVLQVSQQVRKASAELLPNSREQLVASLQSAHQLVWLDLTVSTTGEWTGDPPRQKQGDGVVVKRVGPMHPPHLEQGAGAHLLDAIRGEHDGPAAGGAKLAGVQRVAAVLEGVRGDCLLQHGKFGGLEEVQEFLWKANGVERT